MTFISFFAGIGGIDLGLERAGHECVCQVEIDEYCLKVLEKHWPDVQRFKDITKLTGKELPDAELWTAGFPCQDLSVAGKRAGIEGSRSGLFFELMRLVRVVCPRCILLENVPAILSAGHGRVQGELAEAGYADIWFELSAADMGAPHLRKRWFCFCWRWDVSHPFRSGAGLETYRSSGQGWQSANPQQPEAIPQTNGAVSTTGTNPASQDVGNTKSNYARQSQKQSQDKQQRAASKKNRRGFQHELGRSSTDVADTDQQTEPTLSINAKPGDCLPQPASSDSSGGRWAVEPNVGRVAHGVTSRVDRLKACGNGIVPAVVAEFLWRIEGEK